MMVGKPEKKEAQEQGDEDDGPRGLQNLARGAFREDKSHVSDTTPEVEVASA